MEFFKDKESFEYFCGLVISDGHMSQNSRNRGKIQIELKDSDSSILDKLQSKIEVFSSIRSRTRSSNFSKHFTSRILGIFNQDFRNFLVSKGIPYGSKVNVSIPEWVGNNKNFWRGMIDGDGSLGLTSNGLCFLSFITKSENVALAFGNLILDVCKKEKTFKRNARDSIYNICITNEIAQDMVKFLGYSNTDLAIERKKLSAFDVLNWQRPDWLKKKDFQVKKWTSQEDEFITTHTLDESMESLGRTDKSIKIRLWRLSNNL